MATEGSKALASAVFPPVMTQSELARQLGVSPQWVGDWVHGRAKPSADQMAKLEDLLGIPMRAWTVPVADEESKTGTDHG
jgi:transcriptional regulator with XRE-family HTH domain